MSISVCAACLSLCVQQVEGSAAGTSGQSPAYIPISNPTVPARGDEDNPVYTWHNNFLRVRAALAKGVNVLLWRGNAIVGNACKSRFCKCASPDDSTGYVVCLQPRAEEQ